jgi:hypothetical protein
MSGTPFLSLLLVLIRRVPLQCGSSTAGTGERRPARLLPAKTGRAGNQGPWRRENLTGFAGSARHAHGNREKRCPHCLGDEEVDDALDMLAVTRLPPATPGSVANLPSSSTRTRRPLAASLAACPRCSRCPAGSTISGAPSAHVPWPVKLAALYLRADENGTAAWRTHPPGGGRPARWQIMPSEGKENLS